MNLQSCFKIGYVMKTHGLKGEVTLSLAPDCPDMEGIESVFLQVRNQLVPYFIQSISIKGTKAYVKLEEVNSAEEAEALTGSSLYLSKETRPALPRGEFYSDEVIDFEVIEKNMGLLGHVREVQELGLTRHLIVVRDKKEVMIPVNGPFIRGVNKSRKQITVELPEGFLDL